MNTGLMSKVTQNTSRLLLKAKINSPTILIGVGVVGVVGTVVLASRATLKVSEKVDGFEGEVTSLKTLRDMSEVPDYKKRLTGLYLKHGGDILRSYMPTIIVGTLSVSALIGSHVILKNRNAALAAAYMVVDEAYEQYRKNVRNLFGDEQDKELAHGIIEKLIDGEDDEEPKKIKIIDSHQTASKYARFFDEYSREWEKNPEYNLMFLKSIETRMNNLLHARGHVFLNEVYDALGFDRTPEGQVVGWRSTGDGDHYVDFGLYDITSSSSAKRAFVNGNEYSVLLDFNVDGPIQELI